VFLISGPTKRMKWAGLRVFMISISVVGLSSFFIIKLMFYDWIGIVMEVSIMVGKKNK